MDYKELASTILENVGGETNVVAVGHCATRLRFNLKDEAKANTDVIKATPGVLGVVQKGGQYQIVIGPDVTFVHKAILELGSFDTTGADEADEKTDGDKADEGVVARVLDTIAGSFFPIIPALVGGGMLKAILAILVAAGATTAKDQSYQILNFMGDACFYFLPVLLGFSCAEKFKVNKYVAAAIGAMLISPTFVSMVAAAKEAGTGISLFGLPIQLVSYSSSVIPIFLAVWLQHYVEPFVDKHMFKAGRMIFTPLITTIVVGVAAFTVLGPIGSWLGALLAMLVKFLNGVAPWLVPTLMGTLTPLLVMVGMHYAIIPIGINMLATTGVDTVAGPGMLVSNVAQGGAAFAVAVRAKNADLKALATSCGLTAVLGITEPALYGINLRFKKPLVSAMIGGGVAGFFLGIMGVGRFAQVAPGLLALPSYINTADPTNFSVLIYAAIGCAIAFAVSFGVEMFLGIDEAEAEKEPATTGSGTN